MSLPRYSKYKDSGIEWVGEVPEHWGVVAGRRLFRHIRLQALPDDEQLSATQKYGVIPQSLFMEREDQKVVLALKGTAGFKHVDTDDFVISLRTFQGGIERCLHSGCVSPAYTVLRPSVQIDARYWAYLLKSEPYIASLQAATDGIREGKTISYDQFGQILVPTPPFCEQSAIANVLDEEVSRVDALVAEQQRLVELLKEKQQAVISQAVTKGLNADAPMKDSGVRCIGQVPQHWQVKRLKHIKAPDPNAFVDGPFGSNLKSEHFIEDGDVYVIESNFATTGALDRSELKTISTEHFQTILRSEVGAGDIVIAKIGAQFGKASILPSLDKPAVVSGNSLKLTVNDRLCSVRWAHMQLVNLKQSGEIDLLANGSAQPALSLSAMNQLVFLLPSKIEQDKIVDYVDREIQQLDQISSAATNAIDLLQERRTALISAAVTGKIDVRGVAKGQSA